MQPLVQSSHVYFEVGTITSTLTRARVSDIFSNWPTGKYLAEAEQRGIPRAPHSPVLPIFCGSVCSWEHTLFIPTYFPPPSWERCPCSYPRKVGPGLLRIGDLLQLFNCHYLFEHLECVMNSLSSPDSSQIQYSVSF